MLGGAVEVAVGPCSDAAGLEFVFSGELGSADGFAGPFGPMNDMGRLDR